MKSLFASPTGMVPSSDFERARLRVRNIMVLATVALIGVLVSFVQGGAEQLMVGGALSGLAFSGMIVDAQTRLADAVAITATAIATNVYDTAAAGNDVFIGEPMCVVITVDVAADITTGDETYQFDVNASAAAALSSPTTLVRRIVAASLLTAGAVIVIPIPPGKVLRYVGLNVTLAGTTPSITYTADLLPLSFVQQHKAYADAITISS